MQNKFGKRNLKFVIGYIFIALCVPLTVFFPKIFGLRGYYIAAFTFAIITLARFFLSFEKTSHSAAKITLISVLCALGVSGRIVFAGIPFVKPVGAIVIITGTALGPQAGFLRGAVTMLVSNFMFGQGPWTVWQMLAFGIMGLLAGILFYKRKKLQHPILMAFFGFATYVFITGPILDLSGIFAYTHSGKRSLMAVLLAGLPVNITGGVATFFFLLALSRPLLRKLNRIIVKNDIN